MIGASDGQVGLHFEVREGSYSADRGAATTVATAKPLPAARLEKLLSRLPALEANENDKKSFALRAGSKPAPRAGADQKTPFPPPAGAAGPPPTASAGEPRVIRFSPEGDVDIAPHLSITFSQPMVAVNSHADSIKNIDVALEPKPAGQWRWVGTRTLLFSPEHRFPQATSFKVSVPKGMKTAAGSPLEAAKAWTFQTPPVQIKSVFPRNGPLELDPLLFITFNQKVKASEITKHIYLSAQGSKARVRVATANEIEASDSIRGHVVAATKSEQTDRFLVLRPIAPLSRATNYDLVLGKGAPSAEGPRRTTANQSGFPIQTHGPLKVESHSCDRGIKCPPRSSWSIDMTNPLDADAFDPKTVTITPDLPSAVVSVIGDHVRIRGLPVGRTTYKVTIPASLKDKFGQTLGAEKTLDFHVGPADPGLSGPNGLVVLDPYAAKPTVNVFSTNQKQLSVDVLRVVPEDWPAFAEYMKASRRDQRLDPPGESVFSGNIKTTAGDDKLVETAIDLSPALSQSGAQSHGHAIVVVEPAVWTKDRWKPRVVAWVQVTEIGLDAFVDKTQLLGWATNLRSGKPLSGVEMSISGSSANGTSGANGTANIELPTTATGSRLMLVAKRGSDVAFLPEHASYWSTHQGWIKSDPGLGLRWHIFDDRSMYRPGETVRLKGWIRSVGLGVGGDISAAPSNLKSVRYEVKDSRGQVIGSGTASVNALGGFDTAIELPKTPNLGYARATFQPVGASGQGSHSFQIQEFRRPEYEVTTSISSGPHNVGETATVTASAAYFAGGGLGSAPVQWNVSSSPTSFSPPGHKGFTFGTWTPWWFSPHSRRGRGRPSFGGLGGGGAHKNLAGTTSSAGRHVIEIDLLSVSPAAPANVSATARVTDVNRQTWASTETFLVHPSDLYVGIRRKRYFVDKGKPIEFDMVVADQNGKIVADVPIEASVARLESKYKNGVYSEEKVDPRPCEMTSSKTDVSCSIPTTIGGRYQIVATVRDKHGRANQTTVQTWVAGGARPPARNVELEQVSIIPEKETFAPGESARLLVSAPFDDAEAIMTIRRSGIVSSERFTLSGQTHVLEVPIRAADTPNIHVHVDVVGKAGRLGQGGVVDPNLPPRPAFGAGQITLKIPPVHRTLTVTPTAAVAKLSPGGSTHVDVVVTDASGKPASDAEVAVVVVDESVLSLSGKTTPDPLAVFYQNRAQGARDHHLRSHVKLAKPEAGSLAEAEPPALPAPAPAGRSAGQYAMKAMDGDTFAANGARNKGMLGALKSDKKLNRSPRRRQVEAKEERAGASETPIAVRTNFDALATFAAEQRTDANGKTRVEVKLPDNLTRYRIMAVAVRDAQQFGSGESSIVARMPLMVRPSPPRFLNFGDKFEMPVVVQNQTDKPLEVDVGMRATNATLTAGSGRLVTVPAGGRVEVRFPAKAERPGTARFQVGVGAKNWADAKTFSLPVWTPATTEAFATYGEIGDGPNVISQPVARPSDVVESFGGLEVSTSSTQLQALTDAVLYLHRYPFECSEQLSSRVLSIAGLRDVLAAFEADGLPSPDALSASVAKDLRLLRNSQHSNGGFSFLAQHRHPLAVPLGARDPRSGPSQRERLSGPRPNAQLGAQTHRVD